MKNALLQQSVIELGEGSPWPGIFGLIALVSLVIIIISVAVSPDATTPRKDNPLRHVTTLFAVVGGVSLTLGALTSNLA